MEGEGPDEIMPDDYNCPFMLLEASGAGASRAFLLVILP